MKKGIVFLGLIVFMFCFLSACSSSKSNKAEKYIGVWYGYKVSTDDSDIVFEDYANLVKMELTAEFTSDGKYTLHYYMNGSEGEKYPQKGSYKIDGGKIILTEDEGVGKIVDLRHAGIIIETPRFIDYYSGMKNLKVLCGLSGKPDVAKLKETLSMCGLDPELRISVRKYSLGMRQRLALAQAIMEDQKVLILDEPFNGLDKHGIAEMRTLLLKLKEKGHLIILSSHNAEDVKLLCDHVIEMENGVILRAGK